MKKIKSALISVFHKDGLEPLVRLLAEAGVEIYSTGGTLDFIEKLGVKARSVESLTGFPSILGGRVKTLHPAVFGGILARRDNPKDTEESGQYSIPAIDLVIVDLYPFAQTVAGGGTEQEIIEKIDIGGISLIRAAAKNFKDVAIVSNTGQYEGVYEVLKEQDCSLSLGQRKMLAAEAFAESSGYDSAIFNWFNSDGSIPAIRIATDGGMELRYGENPHQKAEFFGDLSGMFDQLHGKEISYNNLLDIEAAVNLIDDLGDRPTFAILKHNNACGVAVRDNLTDAWKAALACDPVSAFGGVLITNKPVDPATANEINELFFEVIIAPGYDAEALRTLQSKKNRIILVRKEGGYRDRKFRSLLNGTAVQDRDTIVGGRDTELKTVTKREIPSEVVDDLIFANALVKNSKSNAIVLAKDLRLLASGIGQTSRVDALKQAIAKAKSFGFDLSGAVMASDAYFPFADSVEIARGEGIEFVIQPGGSIRDQDTIDYCDSNNMGMAFTGTRHFKH